MSKPKIVEASGGFISAIDLSLNVLNNSKYFTAIMMLLMNLGARYISLELSQFHEEILSNTIVRRVLVFTIVFAATRDIKVSLVSTAVFVILVTGIFNEDSKYCILPGRNNRRLTKDDYHYAQNIIDKYHKQMRKDNEKARIQQQQKAQQAPTTNQPQTNQLNK
jgi:hypothetical protein